MTGAAGGGPAGPGTIDLNADAGEGYGRWTLGDDDALLAVVTSANLACGFHAGDPDVLRYTCARAAERGVVVGAQVSYRDLAGFGRRYVAVPRDSLTNDVLYQIGGLAAMCRAAGIGVRYVKPHGALYHRAVHDPEHALAIVDAVRAYDPGLAVLCQAGSELARCAAEAGLRVVREGFVDRGYTAAGTLVPRSDPGALLTDPVQAGSRAVRMVTEGTVGAVSGEEVSLVVDSLCVHGDTPGAVHVARAVRSALETAGVRVSAFAS
ncbi:MAG: LamB/YcsF family protein [Actinobacteria bacterium]|nr:LamB/YcsF family protein [Actinomycetota bacterium]MBI3686509.1 LamB/YcsF family protein [Actinomycetota bacterium]